MNLMTQAVHHNTAAVKSLLTVMADNDTAAIKTSV